MGAIHNISSWVLSAAIATLVVLIPPAAIADETRSATLEPIEAPGNPARAPALAREHRAADATIPLTRAAARQRVEAMSPTDWLASYGDVVVGRSGTTATADR